MFIPEPIDEQRLERERLPKDIDSKTREYFKTRGWWSQVREQIKRAKNDSFDGEVLVRFELTGEETEEKITGYLCGELFEFNFNREVLIKKLVFLTCNKSTYYDFLTYNPH